MNEILRFELTMRTKSSIKQKCKNIIGSEADMTLKNLFKQKIWDSLIREEVEKIYNNPLKNYILLARENKPIIDAFINKNIKNKQSKDTFMGIIMSVQEKGIKQTRIDYCKESTRQSWLNYKNKLLMLEREIKLDLLDNLSSANILNLVLSEFEIEKRRQYKLLL